jgi:hypothetical protein
MIIGRSRTPLNSSSAAVRRREMVRRSEDNFLRKMQNVRGAAARRVAPGQGNGAVKGKQGALVVGLSGASDFQPVEVSGKGQIQSCVIIDSF